MRAMRCQAGSPWRVVGQLEAARDRHGVQAGGGAGLRLRPGGADRRARGGTPCQSRRSAGRGRVEAGRCGSRKVDAESVPSDASRASGRGSRPCRPPRRARQRARMGLRIALRPWFAPKQRRPGIGAKRRGRDGEVRDQGQLGAVAGEQRPPASLRRCRRPGPGWPPHRAGPRQAGPGLGRGVFVGDGSRLRT